MWPLENMPVQHADSQVASFFSPLKSLATLCLISSAGFYSASTLFDISVKRWPRAKTPKYKRHSRAVRLLADTQTGGMNEMSVLALIFDAGVVTDKP